MYLPDALNVMYLNVFNDSLYDHVNIISLCCLGKFNLLAVISGEYTIDSL